MAVGLKAPALSGCHSSADARVGHPWPFPAHGCTLLTPNHQLHELDTCTHAGHGAALSWPMSAERFFAPFRPIEASPLSLRRFVGEPGLRVLISELLWVWLPCLLLGGWWAWRRRQDQTG
jgi:inner membrane protein